MTNDLYHTDVQWHESNPDGTPKRWHEVGEVDDLSHIADLADLVRAATVHPIGSTQDNATNMDATQSDQITDDTLPVKPPDFQPAHEYPPALDGEGAG